MAENANARRAPGAAVGCSGNDSTAKNTADAINGQDSAKKRRCPGCGRRCTAWAAPVRGWHSAEPTSLCKRFAGALIILRGRVAGLKLKGAPEARP